jgi:hypothetical protein
MVTTTWQVGSKRSGDTLQRELKRKGFRVQWGGNEPEVYVRVTHEPGLLDSLDQIMRAEEPMATIIDN